MITALIFGRAKTVWEEIAAAKELSHFDYVLAVGPVAIDYPGEIDAWVWFHTELFEDCALRRAHKGHPPARSYWANLRRGILQPKREVPHVNRIDCDGGASGLIATYVALDYFKATHVVLAGCPMTAEGGQYDTPKPWREAVKHRQAWLDNQAKLKERVRSMSGWTAELLGSPTVDWLRHDRA